MVAWKKEKKRTQQYLDAIRESQARLEHETFAASLAKHDANGQEIQKFIHQATAGGKSPITNPTGPSGSIRRVRSVIPIPRYGRFRGRQALLQSIHDFLDPSKTQGACRILTICGPGGVGKTQTALEFAYRNIDAFGVVLWAEADTLFKLDSAYVSFASALGLMDGRELRARKRLQVMEAVRHWLSTTGEQIFLTRFKLLVFPQLTTRCRRQ